MIRFSTPLLPDYWTAFGKDFRCVSQVLDSVSDTLRISANERKLLTTGDKKKAPKYTFYALDNAVRYSSANQKDIVGDINDIFEEFVEENPEGDFKDWKNFYYNEYNGKERLDEATETAYDMFLTIRAAIDEIDRENVREFIEALVLNGTYSNQNAREAVINKIVTEVEGCELLADDEGPDECELKLGDRYVSICHEDQKPETSVNRGDIISFYYSENEDDRGISIDISEINTSLDEFY